MVSSSASTGQGSGAGMPGPVVREAAVRAGTFVPAFSRDGMTWIKPSFGWMMHRSGWRPMPVTRASETLGYAPRYSSLGALHEALAWLMANGQVDLGGQQVLAPSLVPGATP